MLNRPDDELVTIQIPKWAFEYLGTRRLEDIDPVLATQMFVKYINRSTEHHHEWQPAGATHYDSYTVRYQMCKTCGERIAGKAIPAEIDPYTRLDRDIDAGYDPNDYHDNELDEDEDEE